MWGIWESIVACASNSCDRLTKVRVVDKARVTGGWDRGRGRGPRGRSLCKGAMNVASAGAVRFSTGTSGGAVGS